MLSRREHQAWALSDHATREYRTNEERRFFETIKNPPPPSDELREMAKEYGKFATPENKDR
jgi:hypothetical protein